MCRPYVLPNRLNAAQYLELLNNILGAQCPETIEELQQQVQVAVATVRASP